MSFVSWFTGGGKQVEKVTNAVINGVDAVFYTEEEKAEDSKARRQLWFKFMELSRDESSIKSVTRRILSFLIIGHWLLFMDAALIFYAIGEISKAKMAFELAASMMWITAGVAAFYFGAHLIRQGKK